MLIFLPLKLHPSYSKPRPINGNKQAICLVFEYSLYHDTNAIQWYVLTKSLKFALLISWAFDDYNFNCTRMNFNKL